MPGVLSYEDGGSHFGGSLSFFFFLILIIVLSGLSVETMREQGQVVSFVKRLTREILRKQTVP